MHKLYKHTVYMYVYCSVSNADILGKIGYKSRPFHSIDPSMLAPSRYKCTVDASVFLSKKLLALYSEVVDVIQDLYSLPGESSIMLYLNMTLSVCRMYIPDKATLIADLDL